MSLDRVTRARLLYDVITLKTLPRDADPRLLEGWDIEVEIAVVSRRDVIAVLDHYLDGRLSGNQVLDWAEFFELRDDVEFEPNDLRDLAYELANPALEGALDPDRARTMRSLLTGPAA